MSERGRQQIGVRSEWLALRHEEAIDPQRPIVDAHHHLFDRPGWRYLLDEMLADLAGGHRVLRTVYVQGRAMLRQDGPDAFRPIGETEFANGTAAMSASGAYGPARIADGIVGFADLRLGASVGEVLDAHIGAGGGKAGRFKGIRQIAVWDRDSSMVNAAYATTEDMLDSATFRQGFEELEQRGLSFDAWLLFHQLPKLTALAKSFPSTRIVLDHCGGIAGSGPYAKRRDEVFQVWRQGISELARCPNVMVKLGGLGMGLTGLGFHLAEQPPSSDQLACAWRPYMEVLIGEFGAGRCMFESNFPMDKASYSYAIGWNAMKRIAMDLSEEEKDNLFWRSASRFYGLTPFDPHCSPAGEP